MSRRARLFAVGLAAEIAVFAITALAAEPSPEGAGTSPAREDVREAPPAGPMSIVQLQPFRYSETVRGDPETDPSTYTLVNLNPRVNREYLLRRRKGSKSEDFHLENADPGEQRLHLDETEAGRLTVVTGSERRVCDPWFQGSPLTAAGQSAGNAYVSLCDGAVFLRNPARGHRTRKETVTDFLRDNVWGGDRVVVFVKERLWKDAFVETLPERQPTPGGGGARSEGKEGDPRPARLAPEREGREVVPRELGVAVRSEASGALVLGQWYRTVHHPGVYLSVVRAGAVAPDILASHRGRVKELDSVEKEAIVYAVAFDLDRFDLGFTLGTEHPRLGWSERVPPQVRDPSLPGPDGIGDASPLVRTGTLRPSEAKRTVATFTGGFRRLHGAFRYGELAVRNRGNHYGFVESGVLFSRLQPGLSTIFVLDDGSIGIKTWTEADDERLPGVVHARQNGVPIVEFDEEENAPVPGKLVGQWGAGNWSGSEQASLRTLRSGACVQPAGDKRFLVYAVFSTATPSAMARVFQSYGCRYALQLDINALEHTYLALYSTRKDELLVEHLIRGMETVDPSSEGKSVPRFVAASDSRDFFYVMRKEKR